MEHAAYMPKGCRRLYAQESDKTVILRLTTELLEEEKADWFAKYYHMGACEPGAEAAAMLQEGKELSPEDGFMPGEYAARMHHAGRNVHENGYCVLENGVGYASLLTEQTGVNDENMGFFQEHFSPEPEDLFYKIWCPGKHIRLYPDLAIEDMGWGMTEVRITDFLSKEDFGMAAGLADNDPECIDFQAMNLSVVPLGAPEGTEPMRIVEANYFRQNERGREIRHRFWVGLNIVNGKPVVFPAGTREETAFYTRNIAYHSGSEFATLSRNVVEFYKERGQG